jgi:hypothetical protein
LVDDNGAKDDKFEFDESGEAIEYISLEQAELLAMRDARDEPGDYGSHVEGVRMVYTLDAQEDREDCYVITLSFRPEGNWKGSVGLEQFFIEKQGVVAHRQVLSLPVSTNVGRNRSESKRFFQNFRFRTNACRAATSAITEGEPFSSSLS